jgi:hypothetical protein
MTTAILQVADTGPLESLVVMLRAVGWVCKMPNVVLRRELRSLGCDTVLDVADLVRGMGYEDPLAIDEAGPEEMAGPSTVYVDVKAHRNGPKVWAKWSNLIDRTLWYRINGGRPEVVPGAGDEVDPPCPVLTPNQWYRDSEAIQSLTCRRAYVCWPPFLRFDDYYSKHPRPFGTSDLPPVYDGPLCLVHNLYGWGYGALVHRFRAELGVRCYGAGSPDGLLPHYHVPRLLLTALAMVHLKSSDAPGYALYEALAAGCPIVCTRRLIWRNRMQDLLIPGETCLVFDRETHEGLSEEDVHQCTAEAKAALERLRDPTENRRIGLAGRERLKALMWSPDRPGDVSSLQTFLQRMFP